MIVYIPRTDGMRDVSDQELHTKRVIRPAPRTRTDAQPVVRSPRAKTAAQSGRTTVDPEGQIWPMAELRTQAPRDPGWSAVACPADPDAPVPVLHLGG